jgi:hypothetical protein
MSTQFLEGFSLSHAAILDGVNGAEGQSVYGVRNGTISTDNGNFENTGDNIVLSEWFWINFANVTIEAGFIPFPTIADITGTGVASSGAAPNDYYAIPLWTLASMSTVTKPLGIRVPSKDNAGNLRTLDFVLYKVQFMPFNFTGPSYKNGLTCNISGRALFSYVNEIGQPLPVTYGGPGTNPATGAAAGLSIGRLVSIPGTETGAFVAEAFQTYTGTDTINSYYYGTLTPQTTTWTGQPV